MPALPTPSAARPGGAVLSLTTRGQFRRDSLAPYAEPHLTRGLLGIATSVVPYLGLSALMYLGLNVSYLLTLALAVPAAGFLMRTFIIFHDCTHGSYLPSRRANMWLGRATGLLVLSPYASWRHSHALHHATAGDLDHRGGGDVTTMTSAEYRALSWRGRFGYRLFRNPLVMFGLGPIFALLILPRIVSRSAPARVRRSVLSTDVVVAALLGALCWLMGWRQYLLVQGPAILLAGGVGIWLFYVQHQFEGVYWENTTRWSYAEAALRGSSYLKLPRFLQFFTGNIGLHHVHHLNPRIPNYNLQRAHDENEIFHDVPTLSFSDGIRAVRLKLYDEHSGRLVTFAEARRVDGQASGPRSPASTASPAG
ncbi:MAG TPA: fatty acid desaturase [Solirubrobacteraceae bacterium]|jgi:omega-6 fatty acid desaturase (delta-12 desaturase)|nr:fatty acid desaturase [Solirubrobacteraceae bacterium]